MKNMPATLHITNIHANDVHHYRGEFIQKKQSNDIVPAQCAVLQTSVNNCRRL
jgi:hypothetical protein